MNKRICAAIPLLVISILLNSCHSNSSDQNTTNNQNNQLVTEENSTTNPLEMIDFFMNNSSTEVQPDTNTTLNESSTNIQENEQPLDTPSPIPVECEPVSSSYFDDVVFIGDSICQGLGNYAVWKKDTFKVDYFGNAEFLTALNFGIRNALLGKKLPLYQGEQLPLEETISKMNVTKVYLLLGLNDIDAFTIDKIVGYYDELINNILEKNPDLKIFIQSVTPLTRFENDGQNLKNLTQDRVDELNWRFFNLAKEKGYYYLDVASVVKDEEGFLPDEYSYNKTCHMKPEALELWIEYLRTHALTSK